MNALLTMEPRTAGTEVLEFIGEADVAFRSEQDRTRCVGCCKDHTNIELATHSATQ